MAVLLGEAIEQLRERIEAGARRIAIPAPPGSGKTAVLRQLAASLAASRRVVRIVVPEGDDAALVALVEAAIQLGGGTSDLLDRVVPRQEPARTAWASRLDAVQEALSGAGDDLLILLDGPRFQGPSGPEGELFGQRAVEITSALLGARAGTIVLAGSWIPEGVAEDAGFQLPLERDQDVALARDAVLRLRGRPSHLLSPVVQQALRALAAAGIDVERIPSQDLRLERLAQKLGDVFKDSLAARRILARLSALRVPFSEDVLERAGISAGPAPTRMVLGELLEVLDGGERLIPDALARRIRALVRAGDPAWELGEPARDAHRFAAAHHRERFQAARERGDVAAAVREEMEEIHQLTEAGDAAALLDRSLQFVEQYDALGKSLSQRALRAPRKQEEKLRRDAVRAYERAIEHDGRDAYAHHYIAYNLDILGTEPERVEREYVTARDLDPAHPWHHGRYVCFLITTAWMDEARAAWGRALDDLAGAGRLMLPAVYEELHAQVARHLLARSELDFAADVLEDVPDELRTAPWWRALEQLRLCLEEDRDERLVFPPTLPLEERWEGPHLAEEQDPLDVQRWRPGRVLGRDSTGVVLQVARRLDERSEVALSTVMFDLRSLCETWNAPLAWLAVGTFVELIEYMNGTKVLRTWDRRSSSFEAVPGLPGLFPSSDRYIRRVLA
ncbi:MAG: hypothetical protein IT372_12060 [Polyangiaceae bacterium]|nr:hypothetical protein [Polyangiaceae bacterium]